MQQGTDEWFAARCGKVTASRVADIMRQTKSGYSATRDKYMGQLIAERLTGFVAKSYTNAAMQWGTDTEPQARAVYEFERLVTVEQIGFVDHPTIAMSGASPDGLVGSDGLVEIKCPETHTHIETLLSGKVSADYVTQMHWQMACTGRTWCDFVSFDPRMPEHLQLFVRRIDAEPERIEEMQDAVTAFLTELEAKVAALQALRVSEAA